MNSTKTLLSVGMLFAFLACFSTGCVSTTIEENNSAYVYIAENGTITYRGEIYSSPDDVIDELLSDGATPATLITLIPQGTIPAMHLQGISNDFGKKRLSHVVNREQKKVSAIIQKKGTGIKQQPPASVPRMKKEGRKGRRSSPEAAEEHRHIRIVEP